MEGYLPGKRVVILGSGDIGLIMARRMTLEGAKVLCVAELMPYSGGLKRNIVQCLNDFDIPLKLSHTVVDIQGKERVTGVTIAQVDEKSRPIPGTEEHYDCDTLLLSVGLIPENELSRQVGVEMAPATNGPKVNESLETSIPGVFACGNVLHVHDLVDYVSEEAVQAGRHAARYILKAGRKAAGRSPWRLGERCATPCPAPSPPSAWRRRPWCASGWGGTSAKAWCGCWRETGCCSPASARGWPPARWNKWCSSGSGSPGTRRRSPWKLWKKRREPDMAVIQLTCISCPLGCP